MAGVDGALVAKAGGKRQVLTLCKTKGHRDLWHRQAHGHSKTQQEPRTQQEEP